MTRFQRYNKNFDSLRQIFFATRRHSLSDRNYMKSYDCRRKKRFLRGVWNTTIIHCTFNYTLFRINTATRLVITLNTFKLNLVYLEFFLEISIVLSVIELGTVPTVTLLCFPNVIYACTLFAYLSTK